jgi:glutamyl-tRNA synthetase
MHTLNEGVELTRFLFVDGVQPDEKAGKLLSPDRAGYLRETAARLEAVEDWKADEIRAVLEKLKDEYQLSKTQAFQPIRAAVTGTTVSPPLFESMELLGPERTLARMRAAVRPAG